jgi:SAM-dependent methyltransferase
MTTRWRLLRTLLQRGFDPAQILVWLAMHRALRDCKSVLDVGCGGNSNLRLLGAQRLAGIDGWAPSVEKARANKTHDEVAQGDVREMDKLFRPGQFDACVALDVIEHLSKEDGLKLAAAMERVAGKTVVFLTPKGFLPQRHTEQSDLQVHLSGWEPAEMRGLGYRVFGMLGPKALRGEYHVLKHRPRAFWAVVSLFCQLVWCRWRPDSAAAILCVKRK